MPADRPDFDAVRTDRPDRSLSERSETKGPDPRPLSEDARGAAEAKGDPGLPTVADAVQVPSLQAGIPEVLAGSLDVPVRWVHVSDSDRVAALLDGGELLLTTGAGWPGDAPALARLVDELADAGLAGIVLELGTRFAVVPPPLVAACRARDLALVSLDREVKFVTVTEEVHRRIIAGQVEALQERQRLHELFTALTLRGAPVEVVVRETARALRAPVVLEDLAHEVVAADTAGLSEADVLAGWPGRSRRLPPEWTRVPVAARGTQWGELIALPGPPHPAGPATVLEQAATALALSRLADGEGAWSRLRAEGLIAALLGERYTTVADIEARLEASGFPVRGRTLHVAAGPAAITPVPERPVDALTLAHSGSPRDEGRGVGILSAVVDGERILLVSLPAGSRLPDALVADLGSGAVSDPADSTTELLAAIPIVRRLARQAEAGTLLRVADRPLARLAAELSGDHRLQEHSARLLAPLIRHDDATDGDLLRVLRAVVAHPGNRTAAASASHLSRSVFYQRLALIADLLDADLDDGETLSALHLALLAHGR
ncbi:Purine catabolism regulatory protein-like family protein [Microbacterium sp. 8M]|uniref:PucR family transcriptional regulator n=1 Tax=Microbacterium sp. 8M TaxID=2653153 RepID=UPI0012EF297C|nr:PucR family transcriptional regulator ligand-binding domain-containing protein [Microbacterium sp. 8M]VXB80445.1 Purine catabolism regulatory protein-like family protein [Microbacterium sp. 8M]